MRSYLYYFFQYAHEFLAYRLKLIFTIIGQFVAPLVMIWVLNNIGAGNAVNMSQAEIINYYIFTSILFLFMSSHVDDFVSESILDGTLAAFLLKPVQFWKVMLTRDLSLRVIRFLTGLPIILVLIIFLPNHNFDFSIINLIRTILMVVISYFLSFIFSFGLGLLAFWLEEVWGFLNLKDVSVLLLSGVLLPFQFFPDSLQKILAFSPFPYLVNWPLRAGFSGNLIFEFMTAIIWLLIFSLLSYHFWKKGLRNYQGLGTY